MPPRRRSASSAARVGIGPSGDRTLVHRGHRRRSRGRLLDDGAVPASIARSGRCGTSCARRPACEARTQPRRAPRRAAARRYPTEASKFVRSRPVGGHRRGRADHADLRSSARSQWHPEGRSDRAVDLQDWTRAGDLGVTDAAAAATRHRERRTGLLCCARARAGTREPAFSDDRRRAISLAPVTSRSSSSAVGRWPSAHSSRRSEPASRWANQSLPNRSRRWSRSWASKAHERRYDGDVEARVDVGEVVRRGSARS